MSSSDARGADAWRIRVVVLNWNSAELTRRCVRSLLATDYPADLLEIVVVDNGSIDGSVPVLRRLFPTIRVLENGANLGFAEGCNRALRDRAGVDAIALVNNDAVVEPGWLTPLVETLRADERAGAAAPKLLFATEFVTVGVEVGGDGPRARLVAAEVDGDDVWSRVLPGDGVAQPPHPSIPLRIEREIAERGELHVPVASDAERITLRFETGRGVTVSCGPASASASASATADGGTVPVVEVTVDASGPRHRRINNLGTGLTPWNEGVELRFGEADDATIEPGIVPGWTGGGVLLRSAYLDEVGLFDPRWFAYYEDTDLSWRGRRAGWHTVTAPTSVLHHLFGGTAGSTWPGFFYLNYRNWLLTVIRNGTRSERRAAFATARQISWPYVRRNVVGRLRRGRRADWAITSRWARVVAGVALNLPHVIRHRRGAIGATPTDHVRDRLQPASRPRPPAPRPGGPLVCYLDVTETLRSGWRAGIQRVVTELATRLLLLDDDLELVPIVWSPLDRAYRRLGPDETERLFEPPPMVNHPPASPPAATGVRALVGPLTRNAVVRPVKEGIRRRRDLASRPQAEADLVLERFERGSVFLDADATWNLVDADRAGLLPRLRAGGVAVVALQHDLLPHTNPDWFDPNLVRVFNRHLGAVARHADLVLCNSRHTQDELVAYCRGHRIEPPLMRVVTFGADIAAAEGTPDRELLATLEDRRVVLSVGTLEPRKNQAVLLDAFERIADAHPDATLVLVGRQGWRIDGLAERIRRHPSFGDRIVWPGRVDDATLDELYGRAVVTVVPSFTEGFGLPVLEALGRGGPVISSRGGALPEAGGTAADYFDPDDVDELVRLLEAHLADDAHHDAAVARARAHVAPTWDEAAAEVAEALRTLARRRR